MQEAFKNLLPYGWAEFFEADYLDSEIKSEEVPAKVIQVERGFYKLALGLDRFVLAEVAGKIRHKAEGAESFPVVGDFVIARLSTDGARAHVTKVLKRKTTLKRQAGDDVQLFAANIDYVFIMTSANDDFNPRRLERYLAMTWDSGAEPVIVLSKIDLSQSTEEYIRELENISYKGPVVLLSSLLGTGLKDLENYLSHAKTSVVVGSSGVGKSTLINKLLGREVIFTQDIREDDDKGRHTTTSRSLYVLPSGGLLIDTPGIRELQLAPSEIGLKQSFQDIEEIVAKCKFTNCQHLKEPGCAIVAALGKGELNEERWAAYLKLLKEQEYLELKKDPVKMLEQKEKWKKINKDLKQKYKIKNRPKGK